MTAVPAAGSATARATPRAAASEAAPAPPGGRAETTAGTPALARLVLRRDRVRIPIWLVALAGLVLSSGASILSAYPDRADLAQYAVTVEGSASLIALSGPAVGLDTYGGRIAWEVWPFGIAVALMAVFAVGRHTRTEEEAGRTELVRSTVVGRHAHSVAALAVSAASSLVVGGAFALVLLALDLPVGGSVLLGASFAAIGLVFGAVALLTAQVTEHARTATGTASAVVGLAFALRAIGDIGSGALSWASPFGWMQATRPYAGDRWWPLALCVVAAGVLTAGALALEARRDVGAGLVRPRPGPPVARASLGHPLGLAWRLQRTSVVAWAAGVALGGLAFGSVADSADDLVGDNEQIRDYLAQIGGASLSDIYLATVLLYLALVGTGFALQATLRARAEEDAHRAEWVLATGLSRMRWLGSHLVVVGVGTVVVLVAAGTGTGVAYGLAVGDSGEVPRLALAALAYAPAVALVAGVAVALVGVTPRATALAWVVLAVSVVVAVLAEVLDLPGWARGLSPFDHVPTVPAVGAEALPLAVLGALAAALVAVGLVGFRRRDLA